jgi:cytosolic carboxypeptidase protein 2/3
VYVAYTVPYTYTQM